MPETEVLQVCSFGPVQKLYEAAKSGDSESIAKAVAAIEKAYRESERLEHIRDLARDQYIDSNCDIDIDDANFTHHNGSDGYWVGAWLWISDEEGHVCDDDCRSNGCQYN
jgi:hypothetical protein